MTKLRIAVIGAGVIGRKHVGWVAGNPDCEVAGIADPAPAASAFAAEKGLRCFAEYEALLDTRPDAAIIATPNALHEPVARACAERRIPMLIEKPVAETREAAQAIADMVEAAKVPALVGHYRRHNPVVRKAREVVREGRLGRLTAVSISMRMLKPDSYFDIGWRRVAGAGPVLINLIHDIDQLRFTCGEVERVQAVARNDVRALEVEDTAAIIFELAGGAVATAIVSDTVTSPFAWDMEADENVDFPAHAADSHVLGGTHGSLALPSLALWRYPEARGWTNRMVSETVEVARADPFPAQMAHFVRVVRGEEEPVVSARDGARTVAVAIAIKEAARTGRAVAL